MTRMKQLGSVVILGLALVPSRTAKAQTWGGTITLSNIVDATDKDYRATGTATLSDVDGGMFWGSEADGYAYLIYTGHLTVTCYDLTPGATYEIGPTSVLLYPLHYKTNRGLPGYSSVTASKDGTLTLDTDVEFVGGYYTYRGAPIPWPPYWSDGWVFEGYYGYGIDVDRKKGANYIPVLGGYWDVVW